MPRLSLISHLSLFTAFLCSLTSGYPSQIEGDDLNISIQYFQGASPISDYVLHYGQQIPIYLDHHFLGQNPYYTLEVTPPTDLIKLEPFLQKLTPQTFSKGNAVISYIGYCNEINRHVLFILTDLAQIYAYLLHISMLSSHTSDMVQQVTIEPLDLACPELGQLDCSSIYGDVDQRILVGCVVKNDESPVLVSVNVGVQENKMTITSCLHFPVVSDQESLNIKYVNGGTDFVILEVESYTGTESEVHDFFIPINNTQTQTFNYTASDIGLVAFTAGFFQSEIAQPLNVHGYAQIGNYLYVFNEMGEMYIAQIKYEPQTGLLTALPPPPDSTQSLHDYRVQRVMQASIWDQAPNRILVEGVDQRNGARTIIELVISMDNPQLPMTNSVYQNLNPYDSFFLNVRGMAMENQNYIFQEMYENDKKFFLRVFSKSLPYYNMPISDYYVTTYGFLQALVIDYYADLIMILEDQQFFICKVQGNALSLGKRESDLLTSRNPTVLPQFKWPWQKDDEVQTEDEDTDIEQPSLQQYEHQVFVYQETGFATQNTQRFNSSFLVKFIPESSLQIYKTNATIVGAYEVGRVTYIKVEHKYFIGPNISLSLSFSENQSLPQSYLEATNATLLPLLTPVKLRIDNPTGYMPYCLNYTYFAAQMSGQEMISMACISKRQIYVFFAPIVDRIPDNTQSNFQEPMVFSAWPFQILDYVSDHDQHLIMLLTKLDQDYFIQVIEFALQQGEIGLIWRGKTDPLPYPPRISEQKVRHLYYSTQEKKLLVLSHYEEFIMSYSVDKDKDPIIYPRSIFKNPYYMSLTHGPLLCIHFIHHYFLLVVYEDSLVVARGSYDFLGQVTEFDYFKKFLQNDYIYVTFGHDKLMLFEQTVLTFYDFHDPFLPTLLRVNRVPYSGFKYYVSQKRGLYVTYDLSHTLMAIMEREEDHTFHLICYRTNTQMSHDSLLFLRELDTDLQQEIRTGEYMYLFGCRCNNRKIADPNILFFSLQTSVVMQEIHLNHLIQIETPTYEISSREPMNLILKPERGCVNLNSAEEPCQLHVPLFGEMSGTVVKVPHQIDRHKNVDISFKRPGQGYGVIMDTYFQGYDLTFKIVNIKDDPKGIGEPLLSVPKYVCHFDMPPSSAINNITHHFFIDTDNLLYPILVTFDLLQTLTLHETTVTDGNWVDVLTIETITLKQFDTIEQMLTLTQADPPYTLWLVYGFFQGSRRIVVYNATSIYTVHSRYLNLSPEALDMFLPTQIMAPWFVPLRWFYDSIDGFLLISYAYNNKYDEPLLLFEVDFSTGQIIERTIINAVQLSLNTFSSTSFFVHNQYPLLVAAGKGPQLTLVDLETETYLHSIDITHYDEVLKSIDELQVAWLHQSGPSEFHAFIQGYGVLTFNITMLVPYNDIDNFGDIIIELLNSVHERGVLDIFRPLESPFAQEGSLILGLFLRHAGQYELKMFNAFQANRSKVLYSISLDQYSSCYRPRFFRPRKTRIGEIFASLVCNGQLLIFKLAQFFYLDLNSALVQNVDPSAFPVTQLLSIQAYNPYDTVGVTLDFKVSVLKPPEGENNLIIGVVTVVIFILITIFLVIAWQLRTIRKRKLSIPKAQDQEINEIIMELREGDEIFDQEEEEEEEEEGEQQQPRGTPGEVELTQF